jgi:hypothetical protein
MKWSHIAAGMLLVGLSAGCGKSSDEDGDGGPGNDASGQDAGFPSMAVGDVMDLADGGGGVLGVKIHADTEGEHYLVVLHAPAWTDQGTEPYSITVTPSSSRESRTAKGRLADEALGGSVGSDMLGLEAASLALVEGTGRVAHPAPLAPPVVGDVRSFCITTSAEQQVEARAEVVTDRFAIWMDTSSTPAAAFENPDDLTQVVATLGDITFPREEIFFGQPPDIDGDGVVNILFTPVLDGFSTGLVNFCDLLAPGAAGCGCSNQGEVISYLAPNVPSTGFPHYLPSVIVETITHELTHIVTFAEKYMQEGQATAFGVENKYVLEGYAELAQDLSGLQLGLVMDEKAALETLSDLSTYRLLADSLGYVGSAKLEGTYYGSAYLVLRYLYDQAGGDTGKPDGTFEDRGGIAFIDALLHSPEVGLANIEARLDRGLGETVFDFFTALALANRGPSHGPISADVRFNYLPTQTDAMTGIVRGFDAYAPLPEQVGGNLSGVATTPVESADGLVTPAGADYLEVVSSKAGDIEIVVTPEPGHTLEARLARIE